ncbi:DUF1570 domain-containing protein [Stieleria marina]|uniref:DUF1570 domain-containing protein n=1 Tax=Stieleria marina TaxID=1930275 RepID=UPI003AF38FC2
MTFRETKTAEPDEADTDDQKLRTVVGELLVEAKDGGLMLLADDGRIWTIQPEQIQHRKSDDTTLVPIDDDEIQRRMLAEMPAGFKVYRTTNYVIVHNTNVDYARRVGGLFEQLYRSFFSFWKNQRWKLPKPRFPLVALVLNDHDDFLRYGTADVGETAKSVIGYYHLASNRMMTFNMPNFERNIATIIHEATHQLAYNCTMQRRFADNPMWLSEGLAMFFESPDTSNPRGWRGIGRVNRVNLNRWNRYQRTRPEESLATLLANDVRFRNAASMEASYGEAWALTYFLIKTKRKQYTQYLKQISEGKPLAELSAKERIDDFEKAFDMTLVELDKAFVTYMRRIR